jgi:tRNA(Ile2) C34 agmatinyltransferase TiaS
MRQLYLFKECEPKQKQLHQDPVCKECDLRHKMEQKCNVVKIKCSKCGKKVRTQSYQDQKTFVCLYCELEIERE